MATEQEIRAKIYSRQKYTLAIIEVLFTAILLIFFQFLGCSHLLAGTIKKAVINNYIGLAIYILTIILAYSLLSLPLSLYRSFFLEHKFNLSRQSLKDWLGDFLKSLVVSCIIFVILIEVFYFILNKFPDIWWLLVAAFWIFFSIILAKLTPVVIIPLFFKYKALADENLKARIIKLAGDMKVKILDVFEINYSIKTTKANAAFVGIGKTKRVILADTLKDKYSHDEIEVILAHEFAHYRLRHLLKLILLNSFFTFILLYLIFKSSGYILREFNLGALNDIANLPLILLYGIIFNTLAEPLGNWLSRKFEKEADRLSLEFTGKNTAFISMMQKLAEQNLADVNPNKWIKWFFFDHPPISERIAMARENLA